MRRSDYDFIGEQSSFNSIPDGISSPETVFNEIKNVFLQSFGDPRNEDLIKNNIEDFSDVGNEFGEM